jgi:Fur family iron response transcriptional regulator
VVPEVDMNDQAPILNDDGIDPAARAAGHQPALTGCPWHDVNEMLQAAGLRPTRQRMALGWLLFGKGARHLTAEMLYEEATLAKVPVSLATVYNTLNQLTDAGLLRQVSVDGTKTYFDTNVTAHHHFYLENNHELVDIPDPHLVLSKMPDVPEGYEIARVDMIRSQTSDCHFGGTRSVNPESRDSGFDADASPRNDGALTPPSHPRKRPTAFAARSSRQSRCRSRGTSHWCIS